MKTHHDTGTKDRLIEAARAIFAEKGLEKARVRDICSLAGTNVAAVNYHFGSKDQLYITVLSENMTQIKQRHPLDSGVTPESSSPTDRLKAFIRGMLGHFLDDENEISAKLGKLVLQEMLNPSEHFMELLEKHIRPCNRLLNDIVQSMLPHVPQDIVARCTGSIMTQFSLFRFDKRVRDSLGPMFSLEDDSLESVTQAITDFSLGGIQRLGALHS